VHASGTGSLEAIDLGQIDAQVLGGKLTGRASASWASTWQAMANLTAQGLDPSRLDKSLPGNLGGTIKADAAVDDEGPSVRITQLTIDGTLRDRPVGMEAAGSYARKSLRLDELTARSGASTLSAEGTIGRMADFSLDIDSPDLGDLWPAFSGKLDARVHVLGPSSRPFVVADATAVGLRLPQAEVGDLTLKASVDASGEDASNLDLSLENAAVSGTSVASLRVTASGNAHAHALSLVADTGIGSADLALSGSLDAPWEANFAWRFELDRATLAYETLAPWALEHKAAGRVSANGAELERSCWRSGEATLCLDANEQQGGQRAYLALTALPLAYFAPLLSERVLLEGDAAATAQVLLPKGGEPQIDVTLRTTPGRIGTAAGESESGASSDAAQQSQGLGFGAAEGHIVSNADRATVDVVWPFERQGKFDLHATVDRKDGEPLTASTIDGDAAIDVGDLSFLPDVVNLVDKTAGTITGDVALSGTLAAPRLAGRIALEKARADLIGPGITVENVSLAVVGDGSGRLDIQGQAESGGGRLEANGALRLQGASPVGNMHVSGEKFQLYATSDATVFVSPDLSLSATRDALRLDGTVLVPSASITPRSLEAGAVSVSPDQVIVGENGESESRAMQRPLRAKLDLQLGDDVTFSGLGLTGSLAGRLQITEQPPEPTTGTGEVRIEKGTYQAYGQKLDIRRGRLLFAGGPITRPGLDIEAVRMPTESVLVGARVRGTLAQPELSIFSEPPMPQQQQLSYLVLGRSLDNVSSSETSALSSAAIALGLKGGNVVSERINKTLGFQEFGIETNPSESGQNASFVIGKYLSPSLYVSYGIGLFKPVNTLTLRYAISSRWRLVTESSSEAKGGDLLYHIERGQ
jgi:translocation and assembly module TamB